MRAYAVLVSVLTVLVGALVLGVPAQAGAAEPSAAAVSVLAQDEPAPGPQLDPQTEADERNSRSKLVVGVAAAVLLGIVIWGRHVRSKRAKGK